MVRPKSKVLLKLIENLSQRNKTYQRRKEGLKKVAHDLAILCNVSVLVICVNPNTGKVESWPGNDEEARDIIVKYQSSSTTVHEDNKHHSMSVLKGQICKFQPNLKHAQGVDLQLLDSKMKLVSERIQLLVNLTKVVAPKECSQGERTTFWPDLMKGAIGVDEPSATFTSHSEYKDGALVDFELDTFPFIPPENSAGAGVFGSDIWTGNGDGKTDYINCAGIGNSCQSYTHYQEDGLMTDPLTSSVAAQEITKEERIKFWQDLMRDAIEVDDPREPAPTFYSHSEYTDGALLDFELDTFPFNPPENSTETGMFGSDLWSGNGD